MNEEKEISLGQLFKVVKKSLKLGLIYILVSVIVASAILFSIQGFTGVKCYSANISFGVASTELKTNMDNKKSEIVFKALENSNLSSELATDVIKNLSIVGIIPDKFAEDEDVEFIPSSYTIKLQKDKTLNLTDGQYLTLIDNISNEYVNAFAKTPLPTITINYNVDNELKNIEYIQVAIDLRNIANSAYMSLSVMDNDVKNYRDFETGKSITDVYAEISSSMYLLGGIQNEIIISKIEKNPNGLKDCIAVAKADANAKKAQYDSIIKSVSEFNKEYSRLPSFAQNTTDSMIVINYTDSLYSNMLSTINLYSSLLGEAEGQLEMFDAWESIINGIATTATPDEKEFASSRLKEIAGNISSSVNDYSKIAKSYNANQNLTSDAKVIKTAKTYTENLISTKIIIITLIAVAVIAYVVAFGKTVSIMKKNNEFSSNN
ncbi:MAG: hypothetical protein MJ066_00845 [Clostridia bacterium]|nr:hypothetical protein [Clostridia bacterium]